MRYRVQVTGYTAWIEKKRVLMSVARFTGMDRAFPPGRANEHIPSISDVDGDVLLGSFTTTTIGIRNTVKSHVTPVMVAADDGNTRCAVRQRIVRVILAAVLIAIRHLIHLIVTHGFSLDAIGGCPA